MTRTLGPLAWMAGVGVAGWLAALAVFGARAHPEVLVGMLGPLAAAGASWIAMVRAALAGPRALTRVMMLALGAKMVWFGAYVVVVLRAFDLRPMPFVVSFVCFFVALYVMEAVWLRRLTARAGHLPQG
jgi:hypothetical protein